MNFYRHIFKNADEFITDIPNNLNQWGFCKADGSSIQSYNDFDSRGTRMIKWRYDTITTLNTSAYQGIYAYKFNNNFIPGLYLNNEGMKVLNGANILFFIPLRNKGFILRSEQTNIITLTPKFKSHDYYIMNSTENSNQGINTIIGLFNNNIANNMIYLSIGPFTPYIVFNSDMTQKEKHNDGYVNLIADNKIFEPIPFAENPYRYRITTDPANTYYKHDLKFTNTIENTCTLLRAPYENQYLDGLYIVTTKPCDSIDGKVFSFDGRNFLGIYDNLAVELPVN